MKLKSHTELATSEVWLNVSRKDKIQEIPLVKKNFCKNQKRPKLDCEFLRENQNEFETLKWMWSNVREVQTNHHVNE